MGEPGMTVGELARATGITVRALHHYDRLGLLRPDRDRAGRRRYGPAEVRRLHQVVALRSFGLTLAEIGPLLDGTGAEPRELFQRQLRRTEEQLAALDRLRNTLLGLVAACSSPDSGAAGAAGAGPPARQLIELIERTTAMTGKLTMEQFEQMKRARDEATAALSPEQLAAMQRERAEQASRLSPEELADMQERRRQLLPDGIG
jgi:MerR family transcriptional regulator, thiopeptide resistance regulator